MNIIRNKRGLDYAGYLVIITFISLVLLIIILYQKSGVSKQTMGEEAESILALKLESQKVNLFIKQAAKYSTLKAFDRLREDTNYSETNLYQKYYTYLNEELNKYLILYNNTELIQDNYDFLIINGSIKGIALKQIALEKDFNGQTIKYYFRPSFVVEIYPQIEEFITFNTILKTNENSV